MSLAVVKSRTSLGIGAPPVLIETHISSGLPRFDIVGLPDTAIKESKHRVRSAIMNADFEFPMERITINLSPADLPKDGGRFDLAIALGILVASGQLDATHLDQYECSGELALSGKLLPIKGMLPFALAADAPMIVAEKNAREACLPKTQPVYALPDLTTVCSHLKTPSIAPHTFSPPPMADDYLVDLNEIHGQTLAKRALEIAAAGQHHLLFVGPPGTGKTMLASRLPTVMPPMSQPEAMELAAIYSTYEKSIEFDHLYRRPFRAPHHSASSAALVGGGQQPRAGEASLAHHGVLFLDELPEFNRNVLEVLREPLESGHICVSRANYRAEFPANFQLVAAMNPCPCGYFGDREHRCRCSPAQIQKYQTKLSGPLLDRIDIQVEVSRSGVSDDSTPESSAQVRERVCKARERQLARQGAVNGTLSGKKFSEICELPGDERTFFQNSTRQLKLSLRSQHHILKVARTIADLDAKPGIEHEHLCEAMLMRRLESYMMRS